MSITKVEASDYLQHLINQPLQYGLKSPDMDLFDIGFGEYININNVCKYAIHFTYGIKLYWKNGKKEEFDSMASHIQFNSSIKALVGAKVKRIALSEKNDLWLDMGECHMVIVTEDSAEESWRFFWPSCDRPHLIGTSVDLYMDVD